ncbi:septum formation inhibitor Maf [Candidatus Woesearchaeota archaeon]|nr:septum formation inhibitor Maf [Candidatus Woesearchaeota archaeon]
MKRKIILASTSPRRNGLLQQIGLEFEVVPSKYEEDMAVAMKPNEMVRRFAEGKAEDVAKKVKTGIIIGADTICVFKNKKIGKPKSREDAVSMLRIFSGKKVYVYSGICIIDKDNCKKIVDHEISWVKMKKMSDEEIQKYVDSGEPLDKAGAFAIQELGGIFVEKVHGCYSNIIGLPLYNLYKNLQRLGVNIFEYEKWKEIK